MTTYSVTISGHCFGYSTVTKRYFVVAANGNDAAKKARKMARDNFDRVDPLPVLIVRV
jgi:hypothetical protein